MARYRPLADGLFEVETSAGPIPVNATEDDLLANGYEPANDPARPPPPVGRLALNEGAGGALNAPVSRSDVAPIMGGLGSGAGGAPAQRLDQDLFSGAPNAPELERSDERRTSVTKETQALVPGSPRSGSSGDKSGTRTKTVSVQAGPRGGGGGKAGMVPVGQVVKKGKPVNAELLEADTDAAIDQRLAIQNRGDIEARRAGELGEVADAALQQQEKEISADELKLEAQRKEYARRQAVIDRERGEVDKLEVDPDKLFSDDGGTFVKVLAGLSILAGGALQGFKGMAQNPGLEAINQAIDRNVQNQKEKLARGRQGVSDKETELERLMAIYGNPEIAERELRQRQLSLVNAYAKRATQDSPEDVQTNVQAALADFEAQRVQQRMAIDQAAQDDVTLQERYSSGGTGAGGGVPAKLDGNGKKALGDIRAAKASLHRFLATHEAAGRPGVLTTGVFGSDSSQELGAQAEALAPGLGRGLEGNAPNESTMKAIRDGILSPDGERIQKAARAYINQLEDRERSLLGDTAPKDPDVETEEE
jgi:hypothetical protein